MYFLNKYLDDHSIFEQCQVIKCHAMLCTALAVSKQFSAFNYSDVKRYLQKPLVPSSEQLQLVLSILNLSQCSRISGTQLIDYYDVQDIIKLGVGIAKSCGKPEELCQLYAYGAIEALRKPDTQLFERYMSSMTETINSTQI